MRRKEHRDRNDLFAFATDLLEDARARDCTQENRFIQKIFLKLSEEFERFAKEDEFWLKIQMISQLRH